MQLESVCTHELEEQSHNLILQTKKAGVMLLSPEQVLDVQTTRDILKSGH